MPGRRVHSPFSVSGVVEGPPSTTTTVPPSTTTVPPTTTTTVPPGEIADIPSNFDVNTFLRNAAVPGSTANEPSGNFRTICRPSHLGWNDPIVAPGQENASHLHLFFGNTAVDENSTYQSLRTTGGSTCEGGPINRTGYWMPAMFDGQGRVVPPSLILVYYKATASGGTLAQQQADIRSTQELPNGLRMIAGSNNGNREHISWGCGDGSGNGNTIPSNCPTGYLIATVSFPSCWDGVNLDSPDHRSHMAYKSYVNGRHVCPASHPVRLVDITENFHWENGATDVGTWSLSSDMGGPRGASLHADWFGAWDNPVQTRWHQHCAVEMRNSNNGNLCDGQTLTGATWSGNITGPGRISGWTPMAE